MRRLKLRIWEEEEAQIKDLGGGGGSNCEFGRMRRIKLRIWEEEEDQIKDLGG
jgi:hypothetical protein